MRLDNWTSFYVFTSLMLINSANLEPHLSSSDKYLDLYVYLSQLIELNEKK